MALHDNPPHRATIKGPPTTTRDAGGGETVTWPTTRQSALKCSINTLSGREVEMFAQMGLTVSHRLGCLTSILSSAVSRGDQVVADDTSAVYKVESIERGRSYGNTPSYTYLALNEIL